jgi:subtilisin
MFKAGSRNSAGQAQRLAQLCQGTVLYNYDGPFSGCALRIADGMLDKLTADPAVDKVEKNYICHYCAEIVPTGVRRINVKLNALSTGISTSIRNVMPGGNVNVGGSFTPIAILDSGIDATHPDLNVVFNMGFNQPNFGDQVGHGTHCAGIAAAIHNDIGVVGVAPGAPLWNIRVGDVNGIPIANGIAALQFMAANSDKVKVLSLSWGAPVVITSLNQAVDYCVSKGQVVCIAAGNSAADSAGFSPASAPSAICVAALADSDGLPGGSGPVTSAGPDDTFALFSNWGTTITVIAPGVDITSTFPVTGSVLGTNYGTISGTSMACPHVAGLAARLLSGPTSKIRNIIPPGSVTSPAAALATLFSNSTETIAGIYDNRTYPLISALGE